MRSEVHGTLFVVGSLEESLLVQKFDYKREKRQGSSSGQICVCGPKKRGLSSITRPPPFPTQVLSRV